MPLADNNTAYEEAVSGCMQMRKSDRPQAVHH